jgi:hypothetical protein
MKRETIYFSIALIVSVIATSLLLTSINANSDVCYLLHATNQLLQGESYGHTIFETNPPMILYLYMPICLFAKLTGLNTISLMQIYFLFLAALSSSCCFVLLRKIIHPQDNILVKSLSIMILYVLFGLPIVHFGQREHILLIFVLPYLFTAVLILENKAIHPFVRLIITICAGLAFALKPFFLVIPFLIESYFLFKKRQIRMEAILFACIWFLYFISIYLFQPDYLHIILPLVSDLYFIGFRESWFFIFLQNYAVLFCLNALAIACIFYKKESYQTLNAVMILAAIGMLIALIIPRTTQSYHTLPIIGLSLLILMSYTNLFFLLNKTKSYALFSVTRSCLQFAVIN